MTRRRPREEAGVSYEEAGVTFAALENSGYLDVLEPRMVEREARKMGIPMTFSHTERDFFLVQHCDRIMDTVAGLAFSGSTLTSDERTKEQQRGTINRAKEIAGRFMEYTLGLQPFALEYHPNMTEAEVRAWAAAVVLALKGPA